MTETQSLLARYVRDGSEDAFRELVTRYFDLVYSTAVRLVDGDTHRAKDVAQIVFADLAKMAGKLSENTTLGGWLHRHTCFVGRNVMRRERRRQARERQAVDMNALDDKSDSLLAVAAPILDEAINELGPDDRQAILLRFFERRSLRSVGEILGTTENVAQKRVARAVEELGGLLSRRGITLSATLLASGLAAAAIKVAPAGLALSVAASVLSSLGSGASIGVSSAKALAMAKIKAATMGALVVAAAFTGMGTFWLPVKSLSNQHKALQPRRIRPEPPEAWSPPHDGARPLTPTLTVQAQHQFSLRQRNPRRPVPR